MKGHCSGVLQTPSADVTDTNWAPRAQPARLSSVLVPNTTPASQSYDPALSRKNGHQGIPPSPGFDRTAVTPAVGRTHSRRFAGKIAHFTVAVVVAITMLPCASAGRPRSHRLIRHARRAHHRDQRCMARSWHSSTELGTPYHPQRSNTAVQPDQSAPGPSGVLLAQRHQNLQTPA